MNGVPLNLDRDSVAALFPFYLELDSQLRVVAAGPGWGKILDPVGLQLGAQIEVLRPRLDALEVAALLAGRETFRLRVESHEMDLRAQMHPVGEGVLVLASPAVRSIADLKQLGLEFEDLAAHDATADLITLVQSMEISMADARHLMDQLRRRRKSLLEAKRIAEEAQRAAEEAAAARYRFLAAMSHEIRTPLNGVLGMGRLLHGTVLSLEQRHFLRSLLQSGEGLLGIVNDILDFSKIDSGRLVLEERDFSPRDLCDEVLRLSAPAARSKGLLLFSVVDVNLPAVLLGDSGRVRQILTNLVGNAIKFTRKGQVKVHLAYREGVFSVEVRDTGIGIPEDRLEALFDPFVQEDASTTRRFGGTGLGLAICRQLARCMDGHVEVSSQVGEGSAFKVLLALTSVAPFVPALTQLGGALAVVEPRTALRESVVDLLRAEGTRVEGFGAAEAVPEGNWERVLLALNTPPPIWLDPAQVVLMADLGDVLQARRESKSYGGYICLPAMRSEIIRAVDPTRPTRSAPAAMDTSGTVGLRVLLVEDNVVNQRVGVALLDRLGCKVVLAVDGLQAVEEVRTQNFDLVLMDCQMPVMDGFQATERIRAIRGPELPVIAMTASVMAEDRVRSKQVGMDAFLTKPVDFEELTAVLLRMGNQQSILDQRAN